MTLVFVEQPKKATFQILENAEILVLLCDGSKTKNTGQFIDDAKDIHRDRYNYENCKYVNSYTNVSIKCIFHGPLSA